MHALRRIDDGVAVRKNVQLAATRAHFLHIALELFQKTVVGRYRHDGHLTVNQRQRSVLELAGRIGFSVDVADFLELEAAFQREGVVEAAPDEEAALGVDEAAGEVLYLLTVGQTGLDDLTGAEQLGGQAAGLCLTQTTSGVGQTEREEVEGAELHHIGFGGRYGDLRAGVGVEDVVRCAGDGAAHHIDDGQHRDAPALGEAESRQRNSEKLAGEKLQRAQVLSDLEKNYESFNNSVKFVMKQAGAGALRGIVGPVSSLIKTENRYSTAVEIALGAAIQNIVAQDEGAAKRAIALLKERGAGRATFLPLTNLKANPVRESDLAARGGYVGLASELVQCDDRYRVVMDSLLGRTIVAEDIDAATAIAKAYSYRYRVVTLDGQVVNAGGSLTGGSVNKNASILSRRGEIDALTAEAKKYAKQAEELEAQLTELRRETDTIQATVDGIEAEEKTAREDLISAQTLVDRLAANVEEAERLNEQALREYDDLTARMEQLRQQKISGGELVKKLTEEVERLTRLSAEGMAAHEMLTAAITEAAEKVTALQMEDIARQKDCEAVQMAIEQMEGQQSGSEAALAALRERQEQLKKDNEAIREEIEQITAGAQSGSSEIEELRRDIKDADAQRDQLEMRRNILSKENSDVISRREAAASELLRLQEKSEGMQEQQNSISAKMWEEYELTRSEAAEQAIPLEDVGAAQKRLSELRSKIRALGAVNVAAIEEYEEVSGRYRFMKEQIDDAENAKKELTRLITELSAQMSAIFTERFAGINRYFGEIFRELFGGGHAELRLTDATDPLETGIEIIVQPPGKIIKNLSALSGGEQAFVAICIYFAILRVNPAPFVLIDEIEAALDDVNVGKFAAYLHRMTDHTQFISITHRRGTMEQGDVLYGVTMEEEGISKLLRLDVAEMEKKFGKSLN